MSFIFPFLGVIFAILVVASIIYGKMNGKIYLQKWQTSLILGIATLLLFWNSMFFYAEPGYSYMVQYITGTQVSILSPGYHVKFLGEVIPIKKVITIRASHDENATGTAVINAQKVLFNDAVRAKVYYSTRFRLPEDPELFLKLAVDFRSQTSLVQSLLIPVNSECIRNSARLISAQDYIAGKGGEFEMAILDQLKNGMYILSTRSISDTSSVVKIDTSALSVSKTKITRYEVKIQENGDGTIKRKNQPCHDYGITIAQSTIEDVDTEDQFDKLLEQQRDAAAQASVQKQKAKAAAFQKDRIIAEGETAKAQIQVDMEIDQVRDLIGAETAKKKAMIMKETNKEQLAADKLSAMSIIVKAKAEADRKRLIFQADGALEKKLDALVKINAGYAEAMGKQPLVPQTYFSSGGGTTSNSGASATSANLVNMMTIMTAKQLGVSPNVK